MSLKDITNHIYGRSNMISRIDRPNMFIKELNIYLDYLKNQIEEAQITMSTKQEKYLKTFVNNLNDGILYYHNLFNDMKDRFNDTKSNILTELDFSKRRLQVLEIKINNL